MLQEMEGPFPGLRELHRKLLQGALLHGNIQASASLLMPCIPNEPSNTLVTEVPEPVPSLCAGNVSVTCVPRDVTLLQLSLIQILIIKAENLCTEPPVRCQYCHIVELLLQAGLDDTIIRLFHTPDKVLSHISSKCLSYLVLFQLRFQNEVNCHWLQFCQKSLCQDPGSITLIPCLTSLISVCKGILTDKRIQNADYLLGILVPIENVIERFCSTYITYLSTAQYQPLALGAESSSQISCLLDFLEVLVALRIELKLNVFLCRRVVSVILPQALNLISSPVLYFVKKQVILVLKRCLLYKAGEDFLPSSHLISHQQDATLVQDMAVLAGSLLKAVQKGWLLQIPVSDRLSSFGGVSEGSAFGPDLGMLGAVSLSVVKALEIWFYDETFNDRVTGHADVVMDLHTVMAGILDFLRHHLKWKDPVHTCEWVSLTFIEQDDDMLEVAKCLLQMYLHHSSLRSCPSETDKGVTSCPSHQCGTNPHCIFLFLLSNVLFDASVLLDFLISSETCFLEYLVRYLKLLKEDWPLFCLTCTFFDESMSLRSHTLSSIPVCSAQEQSAGMLPVQGECTSLPNLHTSTTLVLSPPASGPNDNSRPSTPPSLSGCESSSSQSALQRLVAYDSSEESESEYAESNCSVTIHSAGADSRDIDKHMERLGLRAGHPAFLSTPPASAQARSNTSQNTSTQQKSAQCLEDLREAICRLHRKKLFPYNPSALLRLLTNVGILSKA
ncbi:protein Lines homolog 1 [Pseudophryne corroboree]|uniref:protein Lines homolog 1 n=1 Tax=Pseudophryne corroboree TaxID=495146 RepID=UPI00308176DA